GLVSGPFPERLLAPPARRRFIDLRDLFGQGIQRPFELLDLLLDTPDLVVGPLLEVLVRADDLEDGVDGGEVQAPEDSREDGAQDRDAQADAVRPGTAHGAQEVFHATRLTWGIRGRRGRPYKRAARCTRIGSRG